METQGLPVLLTAEEMSSKLNGLLSAERLTQLADSKHMPCWRVDGNLRFRAVDVKKYIKENMCDIEEGFPLPKTITLYQYNNMPSDKAIPESLLGIARHLHPIHITPNVCGVYFLCLERSVVYVGQTRRLPERMGNHMCNKNIDSAWYIGVPEDQLDEVESAFIRHLKPILNKDRKGRLCSPTADCGNDKIVLDAYSTRNGKRVRKGSREPVIRTPYLNQDRYEWQ